MTNNDIFRRLRYIERFSENTIQEILFSVDVVTKESEINSWLKKEDHEDYLKMEDESLASFLNGLIILKRGKSSEKPLIAEKHLNNNLIFRKINIAYSLRSDDLLKLFRKVDFNISKSELTAFFRSKEHKNYRECKDQILRNLLNALQA